MSSTLQGVLKHKVVNGWRLFWLITLPMCAVIIVEMSRVDLSAAAGVSDMIGFSVRFAAPIIFLVVAISSLQILFPGPVPVWLLRNRKYIGLCFAVAMAWQGTFIAMMSNIHRDHYFENVFYLRDELEGSTGYLFLAAMVVTSFRFGSRLLSSQQWKVLHKTALYFLWAYPFSTYWWAVAHYYGTPQLHDYVFYWAGFTAFALRIAAWGKKRWVKSASPTPLFSRIVGSATIGFALIVAATGAGWQKTITTFLTGPTWSANFELWLPFWPFEPFLSLALIGLGVMLLTIPSAAEYEEPLLARQAE